MSKPGSHWTDDEIAIIRANARKTSKEIAKLLSGRTARSVVCKLRQIGCSSYTPTPWTAEEDEILLSNPRATLTRLTDLLPKRSDVAIKRRRHRLLSPVARAQRAAEVKAKREKQAMMKRRAQRALVAPPAIESKPAMPPVRQPEVGVPFVSASGIHAIRMPDGITLPYIPSIHSPRMKATVLPPPGP